MAIVGFNPATVLTSIDKIKSAWDSVLKGLTDTNQAYFIEPMSAIWGSPQAVTFFIDYEKVIDQMCGEVSNVFQSVVNSMNSAAKNLATISGATWNDVENYKAIKKLDISVIKSDIGGVIGIDLAQVNSLISKLSVIIQDISNGFQIAKMAVNNSGFVGGEMQESLVSSLSKIEQNVISSFNDIKAKATEAIQDTVDTYNIATNNISSSFGGGKDNDCFPSSMRRRLCWRKITKKLVFMTKIRNN